jgi:hypothetical protein
MVSVVVVSVVMVSVIMVSVVMVSIVMVRVVMVSVVMVSAVMLIVVMLSVVMLGVIMLSVVVVRVVAPFEWSPTQAKPRHPPGEFSIKDSSLKSEENMTFIFKKSQIQLKGKLGNGSNLKEHFLASLKVNSKHYFSFGLTEQSRAQCYKSFSRP